MDRKYIYGTPRNCVICGVVFRPRDKDSASTCCSHTCRGKLQTQRATRTCVVCGRSFLPTRPTYVTCSRKCGLAYKKSRRKPNPNTRINQKIAMFCCSVISRCLCNKTDRTYKMLGYRVRDLRDHLESKFEPWMSWDNYGKKEGQWSIDHIIPISRFDPATPVSEINALSNLRPLAHVENCRKGNKWVHLG